jgi:hypothetical protein
MLCHEVFSPQSELVELLFDALLGARILAVQVKEFRDNIIKLETFEVQEFDDVALFELHRNGTFQFYIIYRVSHPRCSIERSVE